MDNMDNFIRRGSKRQNIACLLIVSTIISTPFEYVIVNFLTPYLDYWCDIKEISHCSVDIQKSLISLSGIDGEKFDYCFVSKLNWTQFNTCREDDNSADWKSNVTKEKCSTGFRFDLMGRYTTATSTFNLVCDELWLLEIISPLYTASFVLGSLLSGMSDAYGRKKALMFFIVLHAFGGIVTSFSNNVYIFIIGRLLIGIAVKGNIITALILMIEIFPSKNTQLASWICYIIFASGFSIASLISYLIRDYRLLQIAMSVPFTLILVCWKLIPESPSWLLSKNRFNDAENELKLIAKFGGYLNELESRLMEIPLLDNKEVISSKKLTYVHLFKHKKLLLHSVILCIIMWTTSSTVIGLSMNMGLIFGDVYVNQASVGAIETVSLLAFGFFIFEFKRKTCLLIMLFSLLLCNALSLTFSFVKNFESLITVTTLGANVISVMIGMIVYIYSGELFPTEIRQQACGFFHAVAGILSIISPIVAGKFKLLWSPAPYLVFVCMSIMSIIFACFLPETMGRKLPQKLNDIKP